MLTPPGLYGGGYGAAGMAASASPAMAGMVGSDLHEKAHECGCLQFARLAAVAVAQPAARHVDAIRGAQYDD